MTLRNLVAGLRTLFRKERFEQELDDELSGFLQASAAEKRRRGMSAENAMRQARLEMGSPDGVKERIRDAGWEASIESFWQDIRYGSRVLRSNLEPTAVVVLTLALGIAVNTAIFSVLNGWLLRPLPLPSAEQISVLAAQRQEGSALFSYPELVDFRTQTGQVLSGVIGYSFGIAGLSVDSKPNEFAFTGVSGDFFSVLGVRPVLGRLFSPGEGEKTGEELLVVLGYSYWQSKLAGDPAIVGKQVLLDGRSATVIGVTPREFHGLLFSFDMDGYVPLGTMLSLGDTGHAQEFWSNREHRQLMIAGRLKPGVSRAQAQAAVDVIVARLAAQYPASEKGTKVRVIPEWMARPAAGVSSFIPMIAGVFLLLPIVVLLLACLNVANILLVRATLREREMAIRAALGAGRRRLIRQMLTETLLLITLGSVAGVILGYSAVDASGSMLHSATTTSSQLGYRVDYSFDWRVLAYTLAIATFTLLCVGLWPAFHANRHELNAVLHGGGHGSSPRRRFGIRSVLVVTQVAGSLMLLIVAGLFVRSLARAEHMFMGFDPDQVLTIMLTPKQIGYDEVRTRAFFRDIQATLRGTAGVESASSSYTVPMGMPSPASPIFVEGHPFAKDQRAPVISFNSVDPDYFTTLRIPIVQGRAFNVSDNEAAPRVAIVNQTMARKLWPNEDAIGKRFRRESESGELLTVVGVAHDGQYFFLSPDPQRYFYLPIAQNYSAFRYLEIRSPLPPESLLSSVQEEIRKLAPDLPIIDARTMQDTVHGLAGLFVFRLAASLAAVMGVLGLVLAVVGVYGVVSYNAAQRTHEIGVRVALGAERRDIMKLVLEQGLRLVVAGLLVGLLAAAVLTRGMTKLLIGVGATDPMTYAAVATLLSTVALLACWLPAFKATRVNPVVALRQE